MAHSRYTHQSTHAHRIVRHKAQLKRNPKNREKKDCLDKKDPEVGSWWYLQFLIFVQLLTCPFL